jgi:hypothetical protein
MKSFAARSADTEPEISEGLQLGLVHRVTRAEVAGPTARFDVEVAIEALGDKDPAKLLFHVDCCFELQYTLAQDYAPTAEEVEAFKRANAVFHCWPYMREFVQSSTQRMGLRVPPIPMLRLEPLPPVEAPKSAHPKPATAARHRAIARKGAKRRPT